MAEKEGKNINTALKGVLASDSTLIGLVDGNVRQIETDVEGGLMSFDEGVSKSDINVENGVTGFEPIGKVEENNLQAVSGNDVYSENSMLKENIGIDIIKSNNFAKYLSDSEITDSNIWEQGAYSSTGTLLPSESFIRSKEKYPIYGGVEYDFNIAIAGNACIVFYDKDDKVVGFKKRDSEALSYYSFTYKTPKYTEYYRLSHAKVQINLTLLKIVNIQDIDVVTNNVFEKTKNVQPKIDESIKAVGIVKNPEMSINYVSELTDSEITDSNIWEQGAYSSTGDKLASTSYHRSKKRYRIDNVELNFNIAIAGNACIVFYDKDGNVVDFIKRQDDKYTYFNVIKKVENATHIAISQLDLQTDLKKLKVTNNFSFYPKVITEDNISQYASNTDMRSIWRDMYRPKLKRPIVTIISDDGKPQNMTWFKDLLDEFNVKCTHAIVGGWTKNGQDSDGNSVISESEIKQLYNEGYDIACHTWTHKFMDNQTIEVVEEELSRGKTYLESIINDEVNMFVSPFGVRNNNIDNIVSKYFKANFITGYGYDNKIPLNNFFIKRASLDVNDNAGYDKYDLNWETEILPALNHCKENNEWVVFAIHPHYLQFRQENNPSNWENRRNEVRKLLQWCKDNEVEILNAKLAYSYWSNFINIGVRGYDEKVYQLAMNGSELNSYFE